METLLAVILILAIPGLIGLAAIYGDHPKIKRPARLALTVLDIIVDASTTRRHKHHR